LATYYIKRNNVLTQLTVDTVSTIGSQTSRGVEATADIKLLPNWIVSANGAYTDSVYGTFVDPSTGLDASGQQPPDVPRWTANVWTSVRNIGGLPLEAGAGARFIGSRYGNQTNTLLLDSYTLLNFYASYRLPGNILLSARLNNATNKTYVNWADINYPNQVMLGAPRAYEVSLYSKF
jgi:iron complex outermembrane recepter protein